MVRGLAIVVGLIALAMIAAPFLGEWSPPEPEVVSVSVEPSGAKSDPLEPRPLPPVTDPGTLRDVTPEGVTPAPPVTDELTRIYVPPPPKPKLPPPKKTLFRVQVLDPVTLKAGSDTIRLSGIAPPATDRTCKVAGGNEVPCFRRGTTALQRLIRGRAITCTYGERGDNGVPATCTVANQDLASWLLQFGWVTPVEGASETAQALVKTARDNGRGIWAQ